MALNPTIESLIEDFKYETDEELERKRQVYRSHVVSMTQPDIEASRQDVEFNKQAYKELSKIIQKRQRQKKREFYSEKIGIPLLIAVISIVGVVVGTNITNKQNSAQQEKLYTMEWEKELLNRRYETIERTAKVFEEHYRRNELIKNKTFTKEELEKTAMKYFIELASVTFSAKAFFGPKTDKAIVDLNNMDKKSLIKDIEIKKGEVLQAMADEMDYNLHFFKARPK